MTFAIIYNLFLFSIMVFYLIFTNQGTSRFLDNIYNQKAYIFIYILLVSFSIYSIDYNELAIKNEILYKYGLTNNITKSNLYTLLTNSFIHTDVLHLFINLLFFTYLGFLEYDYGYIIFLLMFLIPSIITSTILTIFIPDDVIILGASDGLCAIFSIIIAENLIIDKLPVGISSKIYDFLFGVIILFGVLFLLTFGQRSGGSNVYTFSAHFLGALSGYIFYCALKFITPNLYDYLIEIGTW